MENEANIDSLVKQIESQIEVKINALNIEYQQQRNVLIEGFKSEALQETQVYLEQELADLRISVLQSESQAKWKVKKDMFLRRRELVDGLFEEATKQVKSFSQTKAYDEWCLKHLIELMNTIDAKSDIELHVKPVDLPLFERICKKNGFDTKVISLESIFVGGFILSDHINSVEYDLTLDYKLRLEKEWFYSHSGLDF